MDILYLVDSLEELFNESHSFLMTKNVLVNEERMLDLIDQMRLSIPEEIKKAQRIITQKEIIIAQANEEANRTIALANDRVEQLVARDEIMQKAEKKATEIIQKAKEETEYIKQEADKYAIESLEKLEMEMTKLISQIRNGIHALQENISQATPESESLYSMNQDKEQSL